MQPWLRADVIQRQLTLLIQPKCWRTVSGGGGGEEVGRQKATFQRRKLFFLCPREGRHVPRSCLSTMSTSGLSGLLLSLFSSSLRSQSPSLQHPASSCLSSLLSQAIPLQRHPTGAFIFPGLREVLPLLMVQRISDEDSTLRLLTTRPVSFLLTTFCK